MKFWSSLSTGVSSEQGSSALVGSVCLRSGLTISPSERNERTDHFSSAKPRLEDDPVRDD